MREALNKSIASMGVKDSNLVVMSADGRMIFKDFIRAAPQRHIDVGIAEGTLIGVASGLARSGKTVIVSAIASFLLRRAYEQICLDVCLDQLPVKLIGIGGGLGYGILGPTHHVPEDVALLRSLPGMEIFIPADAAGACAALEAAMTYRGPSYVRIGTANDRVLDIGHARTDARLPRILRDGRDLTILANGSCAHEALQAAAAAPDGLSARIVEVPCLHPLPAEPLRALLLSGRPILTVEEHFVAGGLGSLIAEMFADQALRPVVTRLGVDRRPPPVCGRDELLAFYGIDAAGIRRSACELVAVDPR